MIQNCEGICSSIVMVTNKNTPLLLTHVRLNIKLEILDSFLKLASDRTLLKHCDVIIAVDLQVKTWKHKANFPKWCYSEKKVCIIINPTLHYTIILIKNLIENIFFFECLQFGR